MGSYFSNVGSFFVFHTDLSDTLPSLWPTFWGSKIWRRKNSCTKIHLRQLGFLPPKGLGKRVNWSKNYASVTVCRQDKLKNSDLHFGGPSKKHTQLCDVRNTTYLGKLWNLSPGTIYWNLYIGLNNKATHIGHVMSSERQNKKDPHFGGPTLYLDWFV